MTTVERTRGGGGQVGSPADPGGDGPGRPLGARLALLALVVAVVTALGVPARSAKGGLTTADEPQYLLSAISLAEDGDLDISDELAEERYRVFHAADLPQQTQPRSDGSRVSPHDPLLPAVLALPVAAGGWIGGRLALVGAAGALAALTAWVAVRRFGVAERTALVTVGALSVVAPLVAYGTQIYPELPAALATMVGVAALTGSMGARGRVALVVAVVALPWLAVKYTPVAATLAALALVRLWRRGDRAPAAAVLGVLVLAGLLYLWFHQAVYGGWTAYAAGDHFVDGEFLALGRDPDPLGRAYRLTGLLTDRGFGLVAWAPVYLLVVAGVAAFVRRRPRHWVAVVLPLAVGWLNATFVAESMHDWSWPGRQVIVVLPLAVVATAWWADQVPRVVGPLLALAGVSLVYWVWLLVEVVTGGATFSLVVDLEETGNPLYRAWRSVLPDHRNPNGLTPPLALGWWLLLGGAVLAGARSVSGPAADGPPARSPSAELREAPVVEER